MNDVRRFEARPISSGGVSLWRLLIRLDMLDELHVSMQPYVADEGTRLFDDVLP